MKINDAYPRRIICLTEECAETLYLLKEESRIVDYKLQPASLQDLQSAFYQSARTGNYQTAILLNCRDWKLPNCQPAKTCLSAWRPTRGRRI